MDRNLSASNKKHVSNLQKGYLVLLMNARIRYYLKYCLPPLLIHLVARRRGVSWCGNYDTWQNALAASSGYDSPVILEKVKQASLKVKQGLAAYERDSLALSKKEYRWPVLAILLKIAAREGNQLHVLDVGGSLGRSYFQHRDLPDHLSEIHWNIVEQESFVACGKACFETEELRFFQDLESCLFVGAVTLAVGYQIFMRWVADNPELRRQQAAGDSGSMSL